MQEVEDRIKAEAAFQNARIEAQMHGHEARDRFYYLLEGAFAAYDRALGDVAGKDVLVVGCSDKGLVPLASRGARVLGIDVADEAIEKVRLELAAKGLDGRARAIVMDAEKLELPERSFDIVLCTGVLHHLDVERATEGFRRVLRTSGRVVMLEPMAWNPPAALYRWLTPSMRSPFEHPLTPRDIRILRTSFARVSIDGYALLSFLSLPFAYLQPLAVLTRPLQRLLAPIDAAMFRLVPPLRYLAWSTVIVCSGPRDD